MIQKADFTNSSRENCQYWIIGHLVNKKSTFVTIFNSVIQNLAHKYKDDLRLYTYMDGGPKKAVWSVVIGIWGRQKMVLFDNHNSKHITSILCSICDTTQGEYQFFIKHDAYGIEFHFKAINIFT